MKYATRVGVVMALAVGATAAHAVELELQCRAVAGAGHLLESRSPARHRPRGPGDIFGSENYGNKFPGEAAVYMGIVHAAIYDAALSPSRAAIEPYAIAIDAPRGASSAAAIATAAHHTLVGSTDLGLQGLQPALGLTAEQQAMLDADYEGYIGAIPDGPAKSNGIGIGEQVAIAITTLRQNDGREPNPDARRSRPAAPGPGVWERNPGTPLPPVLGLRLPGIMPLALGERVAVSSGRAESADQRRVRRRLQPGQGARPCRQRRPHARTNHPGALLDRPRLRQWNEGMLRLASARGLDLVQTARMLAMAHVSGGDAMIWCFDAKYSYWFWSPYQAIPHADTDGNISTSADTAWQPLRATPNFPEYPSAHACHSWRRGGSAENILRHRQDPLLPR